MAKWGLVYFIVAAATLSAFPALGWERPSHFEVIGCQNLFLPLPPEARTTSRPTLGLADHATVVRDLHIQRHYLWQPTEKLKLRIYETWNRVAEQAMLLINLAQFNTLKSLLTVETPVGMQEARLYFQWKDLTPVSEHLQKKDMPLLAIGMKKKYLDVVSWFESQFCDGPNRRCTRQWLNSGLPMISLQWRRRIDNQDFFMSWTISPDTVYVRDNSDELIYLGE